MPDVVQLLRDLIALPSANPADGQPDDTTYGEVRVVDYLEQFFARHGIDTMRQPVLPGRENLIVRLEGTAPQPMILEAHTDTVGIEGMAIAPFDPVVAAGRVSGRGACDDKASLAAMATALVRVARGARPARTCILAATCDEEYRFSGVNAFLAHPEVAGLATDDLPGAMACVGEPTALAVVIAHKGAFRWRLRTHGTAAHSSNPDAGCNAIYRMATVISQLEAYARSLGSRARHPLVGGPTFSVGTIRGGSAVNIVPDRCEILIDRRLIPGEDGEAAREEIVAFLGASTPYELETLLTDWPMETARDAQIVSCLERATTAVCGTCRVTGVQYGTDASKLHRCGVQCVVCGPGNIAQAHTANEWVDIGELEAAVEVYTRVLTG